MKTEYLETDDHLNDNKTAEPKQYFINEENFQLLRNCQQSIFEATEVSPTLRKIINELISLENLEKVKAKFVNKYI